MANKRRFALIGSIIGKVDQTDTPADGDIVYYNGTTERWEYVDLTTLLTGIDADTLDGLDSTAFAEIANTETISAVWTYTAAPVLDYQVDLSGTALDDTVFGLLRVDGGATGDASFANVDLLIHFDGADAATSYTEESSNGFTATFNGTAQLDTAQFKFGTASLLLDGNSDYVTFADDAALEIGSGDFTVECWVRFNSLPSSSGTGGMTLFGKYGASPQRSWHLFFTTGDELRLQYSTNGTSANTRSTNSMPTISTGTWYHVALVRESNVLKIFFDGVLQTGYSTAFTANLFDSTEPFHIGASPNNATIQYLDGWIDELRLTIGVARYSSDFTPPSTAFATSSEPSYVEIGDSSYDTYVSSTLYLRGGKSLRMYDSSNSDYLDVAHDGTNIVFTGVNTTRADWIDFTTFDLHDGAVLRIRNSADTDYGEFSHDGSNFNTAFTNTSAWNVTGMAQVSIDGRVQAAASGIRSSSGFKSYGSGNTGLLYGGDDAAGTDEKYWDLSVLSGGSLRLTTATDAHGLGETVMLATRTGSASTAVTWTTDLFAMGSGTPLRIYDAGNTDYVTMTHDGTNFSFSFTNTGAFFINERIVNTGANSSGFPAGINGYYSTVGGSTTYGATIWALDTAFDGGSAGADSVNTSVYGLRWLRAAHASALSTVGEGVYMLLNGSIYGGMGSTGIYTRGGTLRITDSTNGDYGDFSHDGTNFVTAFTGTTQWDISGATQMQVTGGMDIAIRDAGYLRIFDGTDTDYGTFQHNGTDFTTTFVNTTNWQVSGLTYLDLNTGRYITRSTGSHLTMYDTDDTDTADFSLVERNGGNINLYHYDAGTTTFTLVMRGVREGKTSLYYNGTEKIGAGSAGLELPNATTASTVGAAGGASALPATPTGYVTVKISGTDYKIPYYAT